jgi:hypothetical protein
LRRERAFGKSLKCLAEVDARYDPDNLFCLNNNVAPRHDAR